VGDEEIQLDVIEFGGPGRDGRPRRRWPGLLLLVLAAGLVGVLLLQNAHGGTPSAAPTSPTRTVVRPSLPSPHSSTPVVRDLGHRLLGIGEPWELFALTPYGVLRIQLAKGRITHTPVPPLMSTGPVSFVVGRDWTMVRPLDQVPGYLVPDGQPARRLTGVLDEGGEVFPGPDAEHVWVPATAPGSRANLTLVDVDGRPANAAILVPVEMDGGIFPDATGYVVVTGPGGAYAARPDGLRRITAGAVLATGPTRWLVLECDERFRCGSVVVDRATGARRPLGTGTRSPDRLPGTISPNGDTAALVEEDGRGIAVHLLDLDSGADRRVDTPINVGYADVTMVWSPDSRWLFVIGGTGTLVPIDRATGQVYDLGVDLPPVEQLAIR
jgi:hypothetical protein